MLTDTERRHKEIVREYYRIKEEQDYDAVDALFADDFTVEFVRYHGGVEEFDVDFLKKRWGEYQEAFPDMTYDVHDIVAEDDIAIAYLHYRGTHQGELEGIDPTGEEIEVEQHLQFRFADEKIVDMHSTADKLGGIWRRIGVQPPLE